jgi:hypothetical protein
MKTRFFTASFGLVLLALTGCSTSNTGAPVDDYTSTYGVAAASGSPTMRPGIDPTDVRDPTYLSHPTQRWPEGRPTQRWPAGL